MKNIRFEAKIELDGSLTIPAFATRGLGLMPGTTIDVECPANPTICECTDNALFLSPCCNKHLCSGYTNNQPNLNVPSWILAHAGIPSGADISVIAGDGALVLVAGEDELEDLPLEISELLHELGIMIDPITIIELDKV